MHIHLSREPIELRVVERGPFEIFDKDDNPNDVDDMTDSELSRLSYNGRARNTLINGLCPNEFDKVSSCTTAKEIYHILELCHEGSNSLKKVKLSKLMNYFGNFKLRENESIQEGQAKF